MKVIVADASGESGNESAKNTVVVPVGNPLIVRKTSIVLPASIVQSVMKNLKTLAKGFVLPVSL